MAQKTETYHKSAIKYNDLLAEAAESAALEMEDPTVRDWCISIGKQHRFHSNQHTNALTRLQEAPKAAEPTMNNEEN